MPIRPELRQFYGREWREEVQPRILKRAGNRCERCDARNGALGYRDELGHFHELTAQEARTVPMRRMTQIQLGVAHLDHNPQNNGDDNLAALCRRCHLIHDKLHHKETRSARKDAARPLLAIAPR